MVQYSDFKMIPDAMIVNQIMVVITEEAGGGL